MLHLLGLGFLALVLVAVDTYTDWLDPLTSRLSQAALPFQWVGNIPARVSEWGNESVVSRMQLETENERLRRQLRVHKAQLQRMAAIAAENSRLRNLLNATELLKDRVLVAELIGVSPDPLRHTIVINRGRVDGAHAGQPVLDDVGLMGQITGVREHNSTVLLITDSRHALPVQVVRNGVRAIVEGTGDFRRLQLRHVSPTLDVREGDQLVSSGLGGRFPVGYPVGEVIHIERDPGQSFLDVEVEPAANIERSRHLLLVFSAVEELAGPAKTDEAGGG